MAEGPELLLEGFDGAAGVFVDDGLVFDLGGWREGGKGREEELSSSVWQSHFPFLFFFPSQTIIMVITHIYHNVPSLPAVQT